MKCNTWFGLILIFIICLSTTQAQQKEFTPETLWKLGRLSGGAVSPSEDFALYTVTNYKVDKNTGSTDVYILNLETEETRKINASDLKLSSPRWTSNNRIAFLHNKENQQIIASVDHNGKDYQEIGAFELGTIQEFKLSPRENYLIALQNVKTKKSLADKYPEMTEANVKVTDNLMYRHWDTWNDENSAQLFLYSLQDFKVKNIPKNIQEGESFDGILPPFGGLEDLTFSHDEERIIYTSKKMEPNEFATSTNSDLYEYLILEGTTQNITSSNKGYDTHPRFSPEGDQLAWLSMEKDGFEADKNDIIIKDLENQTTKNLTKDIDLTVSDYKWSKDGKSIYFLAVIHATYQLFEFDVKKGKHRQITEGVYNYTGFYEAGKSFITTRQSMLTPNDLYRVSIKKGDAERLTDINADILDHIAKPTVEKRWITTSDDKKMLTWVILPPNFDSSKKYPSLLYCQGGPQSAVSQFFSFRWNFRLMASQGYVVIAPNRRGLPGFGQEWNDAISKDWGGQPIEDYLSAVDEVKKEPYIDAKRIGAVGASYGGYSVYYLAGIHEGRFSSFISHCGLFNMTSWYGTTEELFFADWELGGPYWLPENKEQFIKNSPHTKVANWDTPMLVIHGGKDYRVPENQGLEAFQAAQLLGLKSRLVYFPEESHWVLSTQNALVWHKEFFGWLEETLD